MAEDNKIATKGALKAAHPDECTFREGDTKCPTGREILSNVARGYKVIIPVTSLDRLVKMRSILYQQSPWLDQIRINVSTLGITYKISEISINGVAYGADEFDTDYIMVPQLGELPSSYYIKFKIIIEDAVVTPVLVDAFGDGCAISPHSQVNVKSTTQFSITEAYGLHRIQFNILNT